MRPAGAHAGDVLGGPGVPCQLEQVGPSSGDRCDARFGVSLHGCGARSEQEVDRRLLLDVVVGKGATVLEVLAGEDEVIHRGRDAFLVLDLLLDVVDRVRGLDFERDRLAGRGFDVDLHCCSLGSDLVAAWRQRRSVHDDGHVSARDQALELVRYRVDEGEASLARGHLDLGRIPEGPEPAERLGER